MPYQLKVHEAPKASVPDVGGVGEFGRALISGLKTELSDIDVVVGFRVTFLRSRIAKADEPAGMTVGDPSTTR